MFSLQSHKKHRIEEFHKHLKAATNFLKNENFFWMKNYVVDCEKRASKVGRSKSQMDWSWQFVFLTWKTDEFDEMFGLK